MGRTYCDINVAFLKGIKKKGGIQEVRCLNLDSFPVSKLLSPSSSL